MTFQSALAFGMAMLILAATPGPGVLTSVAHSLSRGFRSSIFVIAGIVLGDLLFLMLAVFGLSAVAHTLGELFFIVKIIGGGYLIWMGCRLMRKGPFIVNSRDLLPNDGQRRHFLTGLLVTLSNPKVILFYAGFLPTFLDLAHLNLLDVAVLAVIVSCVLGCVLGLYAFGAAKARRLVSSPRATRNINRATGAMLMGAGAVLVTR